MIVGIYGYIGTGKSTLSEYLHQQYGFKLISADVIAKELIDSEIMINFIKTNFPSVYEKDTNQINRSLLRALIFSDFKANEKLSNFFWPLISTKIKQLIAENHSKNSDIVIEAALLNQFEAIEFDIVIYLKARKRILIKRVLARDKRSYLETKTILKMQKNYIKSKPKCNSYIFWTISSNNKSKMCQNIDKLLGKLNIF